jgi:deoxyribodipyrimidine photo-lyase
VPAPADLTTAATSPDLAPGGEHEGLARLRAWTASSLARYDEQHDAVAADATSRISSYLHFGCLSPLEVATRLRTRRGGEAFVRQVCWRDFFQQLLAARPELAWEDLRHRGTPTGTADEAFAAWCAGRTGYPLVDAGMRQLQREGFVHNRVRMVVASFLTKDLDVPWQLGARHFMDLLVDGDVASNQLNWQWVAGTGTDSNAHRVFNPTRQSERFDPDGAYIRRYVPELATVDTGAIHDPSDEERTRVGYPRRIVEHRDAIAGYRARISAPDREHASGKAST